jgi:hypothetical protein
MIQAFQANYATNFFLTRQIDDFSANGSGK